MPAKNATKPRRTSAPALPAGRPPTGEGLPVLARTAAIDVITDGPCVAGSVAHRKSRRVAINTRAWRNSAGDPSTTWPACIGLGQTGHACAGSIWHEYSAGRAHQMGAVACTEAACFPEGS